MIIGDTFRKYMEEAIGRDNALVAFSAFDAPASVSVRLNPFKPSSGMEGEPVSWAEHGRVLSSRPVFTLDPLFHAGAYYVQDSSSMFVGHAFRKLLAGIRKSEDRPLRVLDLCAAPGGKTTDLAASLREAFGDDFILVSNEVMKARAGILAANVAIWGDPNVAVTSDDPSAFPALAGYFDVILADVPCSGEGMFRKDEEAVRQWSEDNVALCQARQRRILADVWPSLAPGGVLIYSTCTFNRYENDLNVLWAARELGAVCLFKEDVLGGMPGVIRTEVGYSLVPGHVDGEGQYCSALRKNSEVEYREVKGRIPRQTKTTREQPVPKGLDALLTRKVVLRQKGETIIGVPENIYQDVAVLEQSLHVIAAGCALGSVKGKNFIPDADLALSVILSPDAYPAVDVDREKALAYLHRDAVTFPDAPLGYLLVRYMGQPLGFVKNLGNRCNSLHPQSRRIRMDIR